MHKSRPKLNFGECMTFESTRCWTLRAQPDWTHFWILRANPTLLNPKIKPKIGLNPKKNGSGLAVLQVMFQIGENLNKLIIEGSTFNPSLCDQSYVIVSVLLKKIDYNKVQ